MKTTTQIQDLNQRDESDPRAERSVSSFPQISHSYQSVQLGGSCGSPIKFHPPAFCEISNEYFAREATLGFLVDTGVFAALFLTALFSIANGLQAVATLIQTVGVL